MSKEIIKELRGKKMRIQDDRPEGETLSLNVWDVLTIPFTGEEGQVFRSLVRLDDVESAVEHGFIAAMMAREEGRIIDLDNAHLIRVGYDTALEWGLVAGMTGVSLD